jgi:hypothetical protein
LKRKVKVAKDCNEGVGDPGKIWAKAVGPGEVEGMAACVIGWSFAFLSSDVVEGSNQGVDPSF